MNQNESIMPWKDDPGAQQVTITSSVVSAKVPVTLEALSEEIAAQADVKTPQRKAILRSMNKKLQLFYKKGLENLSSHEQEQMLFNLFVIWVDRHMGKEHLSLRGNTQAIDAKAKTLWESLVI